MVQAENRTYPQGQAGPQDTTCHLMWHNRVPSTPYHPAKRASLSPLKPLDLTVSFLRNKGEGIASQRTPGCSNKPNPEHGNLARHIPGFLKQKGGNKEKSRETRKYIRNKSNRCSRWTLFGF